MSGRLRTVRGAVFPFALLLAAALLGACSREEAPQVIDEEPTAERVLSAAADRMERVGSFHFDLTQENGTTPIMLGIEMVSASGAIGGPNFQRLDVRAQFRGTPVQVGIVVMPEASYMSNPFTGRWDRVAVGIAQFFDPANGVTALMRTVTGASIEGTETLRGVEVYRIEAEIDSGMLALFSSGAPSGRTLTARAWIGVDDPVVHRIELHGAITEQEPPGIVRRLDLSRFGEDPQITAPE